MLNIIFLSDEVRADNLSNINEANSGEKQKIFTLNDCRVKTGIPSSILPEIRPNANGDQANVPTPVNGKKNIIYLIYFLFNLPKYDELKIPSNEKMIKFQ